MGTVTTLLMSVSTLHQSNSRLESLIHLPNSFFEPLSDKIDRELSDPENYEESELLPEKKAVDDLKRLIAEAEMLMQYRLTTGQIAPYHREISITWRSGNRMLRLTSFSDHRTPRLDFGTTPDGALGEYSFDPLATGSKLREKLDWLKAPATVHVGSLRNY